MAGRTTCSIRDAHPDDGVQIAALLAELGYPGNRGADRLLGVPRPGNRQAPSGGGRERRQRAGLRRDGSNQRPQPDGLPSLLPEPWLPGLGTPQRALPQRSPAATTAMTTTALARSRARSLGDGAGVQAARLGGGRCPARFTGTCHRLDASSHRLDCLFILYTVFVIRVIIGKWSQPVRGCVQPMRSGPTEPPQIRRTPPTASGPRPPARPPRRATALRRATAPRPPAKSPQPAASPAPGRACQCRRRWQPRNWVLMSCEPQCAVPRSRHTELTGRRLATGQHRDSTRLPRDVLFRRWRPLIPG